MSRHRNRNNFQNTIKDYLVPIVWWVILLLLIFSMLGWETTTQSDNVTTEENKVPVDISFKSDTTEAIIEYAGDVQQSIDENSNLYKWETLIVKNGIVNLSFPNGNSVALNKVAKFSYNEDGSYSLYTSDAWIDTKTTSDVTMKYASVSMSPNSVVSLTQNEAWSTIYVLSGSAKVTNMAEVSTSLISGQKVSVARQFASDGELDLSGEKWSIDSYFKGSDWYIENEGHLVIEKTDESVSSSTWSIVWETWKYISFKNLRDEMNIDSSQIDITGNVLSQDVWIITINGETVDISNDRSFVLSGLNVNQKVNDLIIKIYDGSRSILEKNVVTVYNSSSSSSVNSSTTWASTSVSTQNNSVTNSQWVTTYEVDGTDFGFTQPSVTGKFSTTASEITIRWITTAEWISKVEVNGFKLASFNGSTWRYHAFERFETLEEGTNQYKVDYFGEGWNIVYTDYYTIVKKAATPAGSSSSWWDTSSSQEVESQEEQEEVIPEETLFQ